MASSFQGKPNLFLRCNKRKMIFVAHIKPVVSPLWIQSQL
jgi:hypothetical protein